MAPKKETTKVVKETTEETVSVGPEQLLMFGRTPKEIDVITKASLAPKVGVFMARKINLGNYENVDFSFSVQVPVGMNEEEAQIFNALSVEAMQAGIDIVKNETNSRTVKILQQIGRIPKPDDED